MVIRWCAFNSSRIPIQNHDFIPILDVIVIAAITTPQLNYGQIR
jgi:hypothetical protein